MTTSDLLEMNVLSRKTLLENLSRQIPYQWRIQSFSKHKAEATCVAYIDARDVADLLDRHCTDGWQNKYEEIGGNLFCQIGIKIDGEWEWRSDCGVESKTEKEKGQASDAFKRAAVRWGVGRFLYNLEIQRVKTNEAKTSSNFPFPVDEQGKKIWDLTEYLNRRMGQNKPKSLPAPKAQVKALPAPKEVVTKQEALRPWELLEEKGYSEEQSTVLLKGIYQYHKVFKASDMNKEKLGAIIQEVAKIPAKKSQEVLVAKTAQKSNSSIEEEIAKILARLEKLDDSEMVAESDLGLLVLYADSLGEKKIADEIEMAINKKLGYAKIEFIEALNKLQSAKSN